mmetsp:Transcript_20778/g.60444  ORF Transcript_20778/g.60444 Transcript_20778/m.60444 type:complete len:134 (+) Transcript_20778:3360-3761(+)
MYTKARGSVTTTANPLAQSRYAPYFSFTLAQTAVACSFWSGRLKLADKKTTVPANDARVNASKTVATPDPIPDKDEVTHIENKRNIHSFPKFIISFSFVPSVRRNVQKKLRKKRARLTSNGPTHKMNVFKHPS